jgi:hypothetical protein
MSFLPEVELPETFGPFASFRETFGFIPNIFRAQTLLPRVIKAEAQIAGAVLLKECTLSRKPEGISFPYYCCGESEHILHHRSWGDAALPRHD